MIIEQTLVNGVRGLCYDPQKTYGQLYAGNDYEHIPCNRSVFVSDTDVKVAMEDAGWAYSRDLTIDMYAWVWIPNMTREEIQDAHMRGWVYRYFVPATELVVEEPQVETPDSQSLPEPGTAALLTIAFAAAAGAKLTRRLWSR